MPSRHIGATELSDCRRSAACGTPRLRQRRRAHRRIALAAGWPAAGTRSSPATAPMAIQVSLPRSPLSPFAALRVGLERAGRSARRRRPTGRSAYLRGPVQRYRPADPAEWPAPPAPHRTHRGQPRSAAPCRPRRRPARTARTCSRRPRRCRGDGRRCRRELLRLLVTAARVRSESARRHRSGSWSRIESPP